MPVWNRTINLSEVWSDRDLPTPEKAKKIVEIIRASGWLEDTPYPDTLRDCLGHVENVTTTGDFDAAFSYVYDVADEDRVWIET